VFGFLTMVEEVVLRKIKYGLQVILGVIGLFLSVPAHGAGPVLIEAYNSSYKCSAVNSVQKQLKLLLDKYPGTILLSCWYPPPANTNSYEPYAQTFCQEARRAYYKELEMFTVSTPMIIINGRYDANPEKIGTAIKAAFSIDEVIQIDLVREKDGLKLSLPDTVSRQKRGDLYLYAYAPLEADPEEQISFDSSSDAAGPSSPPAPGIDAMSTQYLRPVISMDFIAEWTGGRLDISVPFPHRGKFFYYFPEQLGYIAVLHEKGQYGGVLAVGEVKPETGGAGGPSGGFLPFTPVPVKKAEKENLPVTLPNQ